MQPTIIDPPLTETQDGRPRRVGVEVEFAEFSAADAAEIVQREFGGRIEECDPHDFIIHDTEFGDFECKLDSQFAHPDKLKEERAQAALEGLVDADIAAKVVRRAGNVFGSIGQYWLPVEVVGPPIPYRELARFDRLVRRLVAAGATGTRERLIYAFGVQFNPEVTATDGDYILRHLRAYVLASAWLRREIGIDLVRRILPFIDPFPEPYVELILAADYAPDRAKLIDDYLFFNPTRNRELDMLPLFRLLERGRVDRQIDVTLIKPRPTFHYRLPNASLDDPDWSIVLEWNRWVKVERLAADQAALVELTQAYLANSRRLIPQEWGEMSARWFRD